MTEQTTFDPHDLWDRMLVARAKSALRREYLALAMKLNTLDCGPMFASSIGLLSHHQRRIRRYVKFLRVKGEHVPRVPEFAWGSYDMHYDTHKLA